MIDLFLHHDVETDAKQFAILEDNFNLFMQEIEISLKLIPNDCWGLYDVIDLNRYVFNQLITLNEVKLEIESYIKYNCWHAKYFHYTVTPYFEEVENKELLRIEFRIQDVSTTENEERIRYMNFLLGG